MNLETREWLETDGMGGFASGTVAGVRTRRYHALLLAATTPPTGRVVLVNGLDAWVDTPAGSFVITPQRYLPDVIHPDNAFVPESFRSDPWPSWVYRLPDGTRVEQQIFVRFGAPLVVCTWRLVEKRDNIFLIARPFFSGRDYHALQHENPQFNFTPLESDTRLLWQTYDGLPSITAHSNGEYMQKPFWYRNFLYDEERARGQDCVEDLGSPGSFHWDLSSGEATLIFAAGRDGAAALPRGAAPLDALDMLRDAERERRSAFASRLDRSADQYIVRRSRGRTIVAGYPWFTDWGRDTFIAIRGLCLATGRLADARDILLEWTHVVSDGMLPNRFTDRGEEPEYNSVDASLWFVVAAAELIAAAKDRTDLLDAAQREALEAAVLAIVRGYAAGTRFGIRQTEDGLLAAGAPGVQLTWMDAKVGDWVVTPRSGKPVEVQALWLNALHIASSLEKKWRKDYERGRSAFAERFWLEREGYLCDVVDVDHADGTQDRSFRPNQILAIGGLPLPLLDGERAKRVVDAVERKLWTPLGLRSLAPSEPGYIPRYEGGPLQRDGSYHQGTAWAWLIGPFVEAWLRIRGNTAKARAEARSRFLAPLIAHLDEAGLGHVSEIADGSPPHTPRGCPFQAWSLGELIRIERQVL